MTHVTFARAKTVYHMIRGKRATSLRILARRLRITRAKRKRKPWHVVLGEVT